MEGNMSEGKDKSRRGDAAENHAPRNGDIEKRYAAILHWFVILAFALLLASFVLFGGGVLPSAVPAERVPELWGLSAREYSRETAFPTNWAWVYHLRNSDVLNLASLVLIGAATPICFVPLAVMYLRRRDYAYAIMALLVVAVLVIAATGLVGVE
jgi:hypothetical protein